MSRHLLTTLTGTPRLAAAKPFTILPTRLFSSTTPRQSPPRSDILPVQVAGTGTGTLQHVTVPGKSYTFVSDTYPVLGGADSAPSPVVYALASLSACNQVTGHVVARDHGITLGKWNVEVDGQLPTGVLVQGLKEEDVGGPNWEAVSLRVRVQTDVEGEKWDRFVSEVERRCPITRLFRDSGLKYESTWVNEKLE